MKKCLLFFLILVLTTSICFGQNFTNHTYGLKRSDSKPHTILVGLNSLDSLESLEVDKLLQEFQEIVIFLGSEISEKNLILFRERFPFLVEKEDQIILER